MESRRCARERSFCVRVFAKYYLSIRPISTCRSRCDGKGMLNEVTQLTARVCNQFCQLFALVLWYWSENTLARILICCWCSAQRTRCLPTRPADCESMNGRAIRYMSLTICLRDRRTLYMLRDQELRRCCFTLMGNANYIIHKCVRVFSDWLRPNFLTNCGWWYFCRITRGVTKGGVVVICCSHRSFSVRWRVWRKSVVVDSARFKVSAGDVGCLIVGD